MKRQIHGSDDAATVLRHRAKGSRVHARDQRAYFARWAREHAHEPMFVGPPRDAEWVVRHHEQMAEGLSQLADGVDLAVVQDRARAALADLPPCTLESGEVCSRAEWCAEMLGNVYRAVVRDHGPVRTVEEAAA